MRPVLPHNVKFIIKRLAEHGKDGYIVGGCVRDFLLSKEPYDYDITTDASPEEMLRIFSDVRTLETGLKHGTLTVVLNGEPYEVTTYRIDGEYENHRRPKSVSFTTSLQGDLSRRDFTMNAICYNERDGFIDLYGGIEDIKNKVIRAVGEASVRFEEDALRILRAVRFASVLGFSIEEKTASSAREKAHLLSSVSAERIYTEWKKLLSGKDAYRVIDEYRDILSTFLFRKRISLPKRELFDSASADVRQLALFALSYDNPSESFLEFADRMKTDTKTKSLGALALDNLHAPTETETDIKLLLIRLGAQATRLLVLLKLACGLDSQNALNRLDKVIESGAPASAKELKISGNDIMSLGYKGREVGRILDRLLFLTATSELENEREALLARALMEGNGDNGGV